MAGAATAADLVRRDTGGGGHGHGGGGHDHAHAAAPAPSSGYSEPAGGGGGSSYGAPAASYGAPAQQGYAAPSQGYGASAGGSGGGYAAPATGYGYDVGGYEEEGKFDLSAIIIPILIIFGLSLLFPTITSVSVGRKRRDLDGAASPMTDVVERVNDIYMAVVESEECMERIACEIGGLAGDVGLKENSLTKMADPFVPLKYKKFVKQFKAGADCHKLKCGQLF